MKKLLFFLTLSLAINSAEAQTYDYGALVEESDDKELTEYIEYHDNGNIAAKSFKDKNGDVNGKFTFYYESGNIQAKGQMFDNQMEGDVYIFEDQEAEKLISIGTFKAGEQISNKLLHENGKTKSITPFVNDKIEGVYNEYYEDGTLKSFMEYENDVHNGIYKEYHKNGELHHIGSNANGKPEGIWKYFYDNGSLGVEVVYKNGEVVSEKKYKREETSYNENDSDIFGSLGNSSSSASSTSSRRSAEEIEKSGLLSVKDLQDYEINHIESNYSYLGESNQVLDFNIYTDSETKKLFFKIKHVVTFYDFAETQVSFSDVTSISLKNDKIYLDIKDDKIYFRNGDHDTGWNAWEVDGGNYLEILINDETKRKELYDSFKYLVDHPYKK